MVYKNKYIQEQKKVVKTINLIGCKNLYDFYNEVEIKLCGGLNSGFGRNLDALVDVIRGGFGELQYITSNEVFNICIKNSKLLDNKVINILNVVNKENKNEQKHINIMLE